MFCLTDGAQRPGGAGRLGRPLARLAENGAPVPWAEPGPLQRVLGGNELNIFPRLWLFPARDTEKRSYAGISNQQRNNDGTVGERVE